MEQKLGMEHRVTAVEERSKSNTYRLEELERRQDNLETLAGSVAALAERATANISVKTRITDNHEHCSPDNRIAVL